MLIQTDIGFKILRAYFGKIHPRSTWAIQFTGAGGGVIDSDYSGNVVMIFVNFLDNNYQILQGDQIAQLVFQKIENHGKLEEIINFDDKTSRGKKGFGSTDLKCRNEL